MVSKCKHAYLINSIFNKQTRLKAGWISYGFLLKKICQCCQITSWLNESAWFLYFQCIKIKSELTILKYFS